MESSKWWTLFESTKSSLRELVERYHPSSNTVLIVEPDPRFFADPVPTRSMQPAVTITASRAQAACESICEEIRNKSPDTPVLRFDVAALQKKGTTLCAILNETWFGIPESTACWDLEGFGVLCDLCEGLDEDPSSPSYPGSPEEDSDEQRRSTCLSS